VACRSLIWRGRLQRFILDSASRGCRYVNLLSMIRLCLGQGGMPYFTVLGDMFIKNHYVVLSYEGAKPQVGLGERKDVSPIL
jgi:hypothetical protein